MNYHYNKKQNREKGRCGEILARKYLEEKGYRILEQNYRCCCGEIDLIGLDGTYLVFIEVKARRTNHQGYPSEAVDRKKQKKISQTAAFYFSEHRIREDVPIRFDVVEILRDRIRHIENAFEYYK